MIHASCFINKKYATEIKKSLISDFPSTMMSGLPVCKMSIRVRQMLFYICVWLTLKKPVCESML